MSTLRVNAIVDASGGNTATINTYVPPAPVRAWVNFNGTGTVAIRASLNVSSITDNGVGDYTVNFTTAMPDADYSVSGSMSWSSATWGNLFGLNAGEISTTQVRVMSTDKGNAGYGLNDALVACVSVFR
jgi:hypothetical protein